MKRRQAKIAKLMFKNSLDSHGFVSSIMAKAQLAQITKAGPQGLNRILKTYKRLIEKALEKETITVESAAKFTGLKQLESELLKKTGAKKVNYKTNPHIILGARITHGDWIWDETLDSKLERLTIADEYS